MKRLLLGAALAGAILAPSGAFADHTGANCNYSVGDEHRYAVQPNLVVNADTNGNGGTSGKADQSVGVCTQIGTFEAGHSANRGSNRSAWYPFVKDGFYVVLDGASSNPDPIDGYAGVSNFETGTTNCQVNNCNGSNGGGSFGPPGGPYAPVYAPIICGNSTGPSWDTSQRDGCETS